MSSTKQEFKLRWNMDSISSLNENDRQSPDEEHFGAKWNLVTKRLNGYLTLFLYCEHRQAESVQAQPELRLISASGEVHSKPMAEDTWDDKNSNWGLKEFIKWEELLSKYVSKDEIVLEAIVNIKEINLNKRNFDSSLEDLSDVILIVEGKKFYLSKLYLATQSSYFKTLFFGKFKESEKTEIKLDDITSRDFQKYLEVLHVEPSIDDKSVEGIACVADMYDTPTVIRNCEEFLKKESKKELKEKLEISFQYNLENCQEFFLNQVMTIQDIRSVLPENIKEMNDTLAKNLLEKCSLFK